MSFVHASASAGSLKVKGFPSTKRVPRTVIKLQTALLMLGIGMFFSLAQSASASCDAIDGCANCNGNSCAYQCTGAGCGATCDGDSCAYQCTGAGCGASCDGEKCARGCTEAGCGANCTGPNCALYCTGAGCGANCNGTFMCAYQCTGDGCGANCTGSTYCAGECSGTNCGAGCTDITCAAQCTGASCGANCDGDGCALQCTGAGCGATCDGVNCASQCNGTDCGANCDGQQCADQCSGDNCGANCDGDYCAGSCSGDGCGAGCTGDLCDLNCKDSNNITKYAGGNCGNQLLNPIPCVTTTKKFENRIQGCCREVGFGKGKDGDSHHDTVVVKVFRKVLQQKAMEKCKAACAENADCTAIEIFRKGKKKRGTRKQTFRCELHTAGINGASRRTKSCKKATCHIAQSVCLPPLVPCPSGYTYNSDTTMCDGDEE